MLVIPFITLSIFVWITMIDPMVANGQPKERVILSQESGRDPFLLPLGVRLFSKTDLALGAKGGPSKTEGKPKEIPPSPLRVRAILISDHVRLALIDRHIVKIGDLVHDEKVLEINTDRVILGKGGQKKTLLLSQNPVLLTVEERPSTSALPRNEGDRERGKGE